MIRISIREAKTHFPYYARLVKAGDTVIICDRNVPFAELRPIGPDGITKKPRELGVIKGWFPVPVAFHGPDEELERVIEDNLFSQAKI